MGYLEDPKHMKWLSYIFGIMTAAFGRGVLESFEKGSYFLAGLLLFTIGFLLFMVHKGRTY